MFPELTGIQRFCLVGMLILLGRFLFGKLNADQTHRISRWSRMVSSFTLVIAACGLGVNQPILR